MYKIKKIKGIRGWACLRYSGEGKWTYLKPALWPGGLTEELTLSDARSAVLNLNESLGFQKEERRREGALRRVSAITAKASRWLPTDVVADWEASELDPLGPRAIAKQRSLQTYVKEMIVGVNKEPKLWTGFARLFYDYIAKHPISEDYYIRVFRSLNHYGYFYAVWREAPFRDVGLPSGAAKEKILNAFRKRKNSIKRSAPLLPEDMERLKSTMSPAGYNWVAACMWLGLRPEEADQLASPPGPLWELLPGPAGGIRIFQPKLKNLADPERAYKFVPIEDSRQMEALHDIMRGPVARPTRRGADRKALPPGVKLYGGRHGFSQWQKFEKGLTPQELGKRLGHGEQSSVTERSYYEGGAKRGRKR